MLTQSELMELLDYNQKTGEVSARVASGKRKTGPIGTTNTNGYLVVIIRGRQYRLHRLAWFLTHGTWPKEIDHINGNKADNRLANLRECTRSQNQANRNGMMSTNSSGFRGVSRSGRRWQAFVAKKPLGRFPTAEQAAMAYNLAAFRKWGRFAQLNFPVRVQLPEMEG